MLTRAFSRPVVAVASSANLVHFRHQGSGLGTPHMPQPEDDDRPKWMKDPFDYALRSDFYKKESRGETTAQVSAVDGRNFYPEREPENPNYDRFPERMGHDQYPDYKANNEFDALSAEGKSTYGEGTWLMLRALYKDLVDEMRREIQVKPPPPVHFESEKQGAQWVVNHEAGSKILSFTRVPNEADKKEGKSLCVVHTELKIEDPPLKNDRIYHVNHFEFTVLIFKDGLVFEGLFYMLERKFNGMKFKIYQDTENKKSRAVGRNTSEIAGQGKHLAQWDDEPNYVRNKLVYDGPYLRHLEMDHANELQSIVYDEGVDPHTIKFFTDWAHYLEHVEYVRWNLLFQKAVDGSGKSAATPPIRAESALVTREERQELDLATEEWLPAHSI